MSVNYWKKTREKTTTITTRISKLSFVMLVSAVLVLSSIAAAQLFVTHNNSVAYAQSPSLSADCQLSGMFFSAFVTVTSLDSENLWILEATYTSGFSKQEVTELHGVISDMTLVFPVESGTSATFNLYEDVDNNFALRGLESDELRATATTFCGPSPSAPVISAEDKTVVATSAGGTAVTYSVTATDDVDGTATLEEDGTTVTQDSVGGEIDISCTSQSGSAFPIGTTTVTCTATDAAGNENTVSFTVTVSNPAPLPLTELFDNQGQCIREANTNPDSGITRRACQEAFLTDDEGAEEEPEVELEEEEQPAATATPEEETGGEEQPAAAEEEAGGEEQPAAAEEEAGGEEQPAAAEEEAGGEAEEQQPSTEEEAGGEEGETNNLG
jgi:hypothetical protein